MKKTSVYIKSIPMILCTAFLLFTAVRGWSLYADTMGEWYRNRKDMPFAQMTQTVQSNWLEDYEYKKNFINLNGLYARLIGKKVSNGIVKLNNGMITSSEEKRLDMTMHINNITRYAKTIEEASIPFLYVQAPDKVDLQGKVLPKGVTYEMNANTDDLLTGLQQNQIKAIDLRTVLSATPELVDRYFYKTDHHWNAQGAFIGYTETMAAIKEILGREECNIDPVTVQPESWELHEKKQCFLGSRGRRVGKYFAGLDDLTWYTPRFDTHMICSIPSRDVYLEGDFTDTVIRKQYYEEDLDLFDENPYAVYMGKDYPLVLHRNEQAQSRKKVLLIKDSYALPVEAFMSTAFQEMDVVDARYLEDMTIYEYTMECHPDIVVMLLSGNSFALNNMFEFGLEEE